MRPLARRGSNKHRAARSFRRSVGRTKVLNLRGAPMRGGIRL